jgi:phage baseplate assembly protein V
MNGHLYALGELDRRVGNMMRWGTIASVDPANGVATVDIGDLVTGAIPWLTPHAGQDREWSTPDVGEQVIVLSNGDPSQGVIIGSSFSNANSANGSDGDTRRTTFRDGTVVEFNRATSVMNVNVNDAGSLNLIVGGSTATLVNDTITLTIGSTSLTLKDGQATLKATAIKLDGDTTCTKSMTVQGLLTYQAGMAGSGGTGNSAQITGNVQVTGNISNTGALTNNGKNVGSAHTHSGVQTGSGSTGAPN